MRYNLKKDLLNYSLLTYSGVAMIILCLVSSLGLLWDERLLNGINVWIKPMKFQASVGLYLLTFAWFLNFASRPFQQSWKRHWFIFSLLVTGWFEVIYITFQASQGETSHFNQSSAFSALMYTLMGIGAFVMTLNALWLGRHIISHSGSSLARTVRWSIGLGLIISFFGGIEGYFMAAQEGHIVGAAENDSQGLPILGWHTSAGDLRVAHFFGLHAMHFIPFLGWCLHKYIPHQSYWLLLFTTLIYSSLTIGTLILALHSISLLG